MIYPGRRVGNSTRQADAYIQELFENKIVYIRDHACNSENKANFFLVDTIVNRMRFEHSIECKVVEKTKEYITLKIEL